MNETAFTSLRQALAHADTARSLVLNNQGLRKLPATLAQLTCLESLDLSVNPLQRLPEALFELTNLRRLYIDGTLLDELPTALGRLDQLTELRLGGFNRFEIIPAALANLKQLQILDLTDSTRLLSLPEWLMDLPNLQELRLVRTGQIANLAAVVARLPHLRRLVMEDAPFVHFPERPAWLHSLQHLEIMQTQVQALPTWLDEMQALASLRLESNPDLEAFPAALGSLANLRDLYLQPETPLQLPTELGRLARLERLALVRCNLTEVPAWIFDLTQLTRLYLGLNPITHVAPEIVRLTRLSELDFGYNPELTPLRPQIEQWLPNCKLELTPLPKEEAEKEAPPATPLPYTSPRDPSAAALWPEFASSAAWQALTSQQQAEAAADLARALGAYYQVLPPTETGGLPRLHDGKRDLTLVVIVGGRFTMGLRDEERRTLKKLTKHWSPESRAHVRALETIARPLRQVQVPPFLCAQAPVTAAQAAERLVRVEVAGPVCLFDPEQAADFAAQMAARLLSEAEWEYVARRGSGHAWLGLDGDADQAGLAAAAAAALEQDLQAPTSADFGVAGAAWGSWVEDGWRPNYTGAPVDGSARLPRRLPETLRGGALLSLPWQIDGEALLLHTAHRERGRASAAYPLLLGRDLPPRV